MNKNESNFHSYRFTVPSDVIDRNNHVNNVTFLQWMQDAAVAHSRAVLRKGIYEDLKATWVAREHHIKYIAPTLLNDVVEVQTWIAELRRVRCLRMYRFVRVSTAETLVEGDSTWVFTDLNGRPRKIPKEVLDCFPVANHDVNDR